jgi:hypothetical protein
LVFPWQLFSQLSREESNVWQKISFEWKLAKSTKLRHKRFLGEKAQNVKREILTPFHFHLFLFAFLVWRLSYQKLQIVVYKYL